MAARPLLRLFPALLAAAILGLLAAGCSSRPTYPKAQMAESLQQILQSDSLNTRVRFIDHTLAVQLEYPDALTQREGQIGIGPSFDDAARRVLTAVHRVLLSSDAEVRFYVLLISDPNVPGAYLTLVRYLDDIKRANANMIDTFEMFARTIIELDFVGPSHLTLEQYVPRDIRLEEFLSWQLARRIQYTLSDELQAEGVASVGRCGGKFQDGEFAFTLNVEPLGEAGLDEATIHKVFQTSTGVIAKVLSSYRFDEFDRIRLIHPLTGRNLVLPRTNLEIFR
ncbi:MAG: hypothetical protein HY599_03350 [Candidatus Omnitrophica bacterium]|nr:hypothetical protein [Candidatus Omnitrophota bacterium]